MRKALIPVFALTAMSFFSNAQKQDTTRQRMSDTELGHYYLQKSKNQKTIAWILATAGAAGWIGGTAASINYNESPGDTKDMNAGDVVMLLGFGCIAASIPIFISAAKYKGRAEILLRYEKRPMAYQPAGNRYFPVIGLRVPLSGK